MSENKQPLRTLIAALAAMEPVTLRGQEYSGVYLSTLLATNPELPEDEANRTPRLISELGRLAAAAMYEKEMTEARYRVWREGMIFKLTNDLRAAEKAGFECATNPGKDSKGKEKEAKCPAITAAEGYIRTLPEYVKHYEAQSRANETWATLYAALEAAKARQWSIRAWESTGGTATRARTATQSDAAASPTVEDDSPNRYHPGHGDAEPTVEEMERRAAAGKRTPLPARTASAGPPPDPSARKSAPPPEPPATTETKGKSKKAPPPPPRS